MNQLSDQMTTETYADRFAPVVSVLMAVRDVPVPMLEQAITSVLGQTFDDFEFLIYNDGGQDQKVLDTLEHFASLDPRIELHHEPPRGLTRTLNIGLANAHGRYIARHDADDWSEPDRFAKQVEFLERNPDIAVCGSNAWMHQEQGPRLWATRFPLEPDKIKDALHERNPFVHGATMFRIQAARRLGGYREEFVCSQDYDFFWRMCDAAGGANLPDPLYHYRFRTGAVSGQRATDQARVHMATKALAWARRIGANADVSAALEEAGRQLHETPEGLNSQLKQADHRMLAGDYSAAYRDYVSLLRRNPFSLLAWGKLIRFVVFLAIPPARSLCFR